MKILQNLTKNGKSILETSFTAYCNIILIV